MDLAGKTVLVTGGSRGLGLGLVEVLVERSARIVVVARGADALQRVQQRLPGVRTIVADVTDRNSANQILVDVNPDVLILNAGAKPPMGPLDEISWIDFTETWNTDVKAGLYWLQAALNTPLKAGSRIIVVSSGAAEGGSPLSGGYAGAKRMLWVMAKYANGVADKKHLDLRFQSVLPMQMIAGTGVGDTGAQAYADELGISPDAFLSRFGAPMPPRDFGLKVVEILEKAEYTSGLAFGLKGGSDIVVLEESKK